MDEKPKAAWSVMRETYRATMFCAYLVLMDDNGAFAIYQKYDMLKEHLEDFEPVVATQSTNLMMIVDKDTATILWTAAGVGKTVGEQMPEIHQLWTTLAKQPRYFLVGDVTHDNWNGGKPCQG